MNELWLPPTPPGFRGLDPDLPIRVRTRNLPHWRQHGATYFVTFRLADAVPQEKLRALKRWREQWERTHPHPRSNAAWEELAREIFRQTEAWLDKGYGESVLRDEVCADLIEQALQHFHGTRCLASCYVIMPNHIHAIIRPLDDYELSDVLASIKSYVAHQVNQHLTRSGRLWQTESYDRIIRDEEHLFQVIQYIGRNPQKAGLDPAACRCWIREDWAQLGWGFRQGP
jgi:REP element-mobilizing transposase RayT